MWSLCDSYPFCSLSVTLRSGNGVGEITIATVFPVNPVIDYPQYGEYGIYGIYLLYLVWLIIRNLTKILIFLRTHSLPFSNILKSPQKFISNILSSWKSMNVFLELASGFCGYCGFSGFENRNNRTYIFTTSDTCRFFISPFSFHLSVFTFQFSPFSFHLPVFTGIKKREHFARAWFINCSPKDVL